MNSRVLKWLCMVWCSGVAGAGLPEPRMSYLDNGVIRVGMDLSLGGAVTFLESKARPGNLINSADLGRQIQMSHYSGPWPYAPEGKAPRKDWAGLGWNPIQTGDCYMHPSRVLEHRNDGEELYIRCVPMQWPLENVPGDCEFETWSRLDGAMLRMRFRCTNRRADRTFYRPCPQELPAMYTISKLSRLMSYTGERPFSGGEVSWVENDWRAGWPWKSFVATERWAALVDEKGWGVGVFKDDGGEFHGGVYGDERSSDPKHWTTSYVAPIHRENFDHNLVYEHETVFLVGELDWIREQSMGMASRGLPAWRFETGREHWVIEGGADEGYPLSGVWWMCWGGERGRLVGPIRCWRAEDGGGIRVEVAVEGQGGEMRLLWRRLGDDGFAEERSTVWRVRGGGEFQGHVIDLAGEENYSGLVVGLALEPVGEAWEGQRVGIRSVEVLGAER